jgi:uncharacterized membrane protein
MVAADADHDGWFDHMGGWAGWWVIFPIGMMIFMVLMMSRMWGSGMGMMGGHGDEDEPVADSARELLGRRYAAGELTGEEFDAMRHRLEGS